MLIKEDSMLLFRFDFGVGHVAKMICQLPLLIQ